MIIELTFGREKSLVGKVTHGLPNLYALPNFLICIGGNIEVIMTTTNASMSSPMLRAYWNQPERFNEVICLLIILD